MQITDHNKASHHHDHWWWELRCGLLIELQYKQLIMVLYLTVKYWQGACCSWLCMNLDPILSKMLFYTRTEVQKNE